MSEPITEHRQKLAQGAVVTLFDLDMSAWGE